MLSDYHLIRRYKLKLNELYSSDPKGMYWFNFGINWRAIVAFAMGVWPLMPGFIQTVTADGEPALNGWTRLYHLTFLIGLALSFSTFWLLNYISPPPGLGEEAPIVDQALVVDGEDIIHGVPQTGSLEKQESRDWAAGEDEKRRAVAGLSV